MARLAYISFDQVPAPKGASTHIAAFARGLATEFGAVDLVTVGTTPAVTGPFERWPGVSHWELPAAGVSLIDRVLSFGVALTRWLEGREYEVIQFRSIFEGLPILRGRKRAALVFEVNGLPSIELKYRYPGCEDDRELMAKIVAQERACVAAADRMVTPSAVTRDFLVESRGADRRRVAVIPNGVDVELFRPQDGVDEQRLLYFGTLSAWQGVELAIRALARVEGTLTIVGTGSKAQREGLMSLAAKLGCAGRVVVSPPMSQEELGSEMARCSAVLAPLVWNDRNVVQGCCPLKVLEGMAAGRPVISSDLEVVRQLGTHEEHFLLAKAGSVDLMAGAIQRLRGDPQLASKLASKARRLVEERYTWAHATASLAAVYRELIDRSVRDGGGHVPVRS